MSINKNQSRIAYKIDYIKSLPTPQICQFVYKHYNTNDQFYPYQAIFNDVSNADYVLSIILYPNIIAGIIIIKYKSFSNNNKLFQRAFIQYLCIHSNMNKNKFKNLLLKYVNNDSECKYELCSIDEDIILTDNNCTRNIEYYMCPLHEWTTDLETHFRIVNKSQVNSRILYNCYSLYVNTVISHNNTFSYNILKDFDEVFNNKNYLFLISVKAPFSFAIMKNNYYSNYIFPELLMFCSENSKKSILQLLQYLVNNNIKGLILSSLSTINTNKLIKIIKRDLDIIKTSNNCKVYNLDFNPNMILT